jgi:hypothetical protein
MPSPFGEKIFGPNGHGPRPGYRDPSRLWQEILSGIGRMSWCEPRGVPVFPLDEHQGVRPNMVKPSDGRWRR